MPEACRFRREEARWGSNIAHIQFLLFVIAILLVSIFWVLSKINSLLKKTLLREKAQVYERAKKVA
jgi:hypothetical protein